MSKILKQKLIRGWCCALTMALTMFLLGLHLSATAAMAQSGVQEFALSASHHSSDSTTVVTDTGAAPQSGEHASMETGPGQGKCCAVMDHCGLSCPVMVFNGEEAVSFRPFFPSLQTPFRAASIEGQTPPPLFRPPILFS
ncbi:MAG: hypothetical protein ISR48_09955 [Alphaproteobacteria bacterium]|nr:hypothetical protein [Alphaproteobacteria bacterium]